MPLPGPGYVQPTALLQLIAMNRMPSQGTVNQNLVLCQNIMNLVFPKLHLNFLDDKPQQFDFDRFQRVVSSLYLRGQGNVGTADISEMYLDPTSPISPSHPESSTSASDFMEIRILLPPKPEALELIYTTWNKACVLFRFYHRPSLLEEVELLYSMDPLMYTNRQQRFLPFMYLVLACGRLFSKNDGSSPSEADDGFQYFQEACKLLDISNVADIPLIQTVVMMTIYLQCSARLLTCYSYIGIALRSALKEGLHRNLSIFQSRRKLDPIEVDTRKRLFYTIYKMDIYINSLLGLPRSISADEFDQEFPIELDDENITRDGLLFDKQEGRLSSAACANQHTKLIMIWSKITQKLYPIKLNKLNNDSYSSKNIHDRVTCLEQELKAWLENLPQELIPTDPNDPQSGSTIPDRFKLANYYLHLLFLNAQISLYRPFIHYISNGYQASFSDPRSLIRGRNCIKVARMVVKLANKMIDQKLLSGTYWFLMYTIFYSIACLIYYFHFANYNNGNSQMGVNYAGVLFDDDLNIDAIRKDIEIGRKILDTMKNTSNASLRIYSILNSLFEQLNRRTANTSMKSNLMLNLLIADINEASVQLMLENFEIINDFGTRQLDEPPLASAGLGEPQSEGPGAAIPIFENDESLAGDKIGEQGNADEVSKPLDGAVPQIPTEGPEMWESVNYVPGVIDAIDTQIFGRILPPYMLEGSQQRWPGEGTDGVNSDAQNGTPFGLLDPFYS